ncbi:MAG: hypothetical protein P4L80_05245 [Xanthobacteraceae bacterium]|nr:hypothetical protein [Xanthobacteraceae bacterium]
MPATDAVIIAAIVAAFIVFGAVLAWGDYQTRNLRRPARQGAETAGKTPEATRVIQPQNARDTKVSAFH